MKRFCLHVLATILLMSGVPSGAAAAAPVLERVVMVSRHGVRAPIRSVEILQALTRRNWPAWPVGPGEMTPHGATNLSLMADYLRQTYASAGVLPLSGCPSADAVAVVADVADHRTRQSGDIFAAHLAPGCRLAATHAPEGSIDPLFDAGHTNACPVGASARAGAMLAASRDNGLLRPEDRRALERVQEIVAPGACKAGAGLCLVPASDASSLTAAASLALGGTIAEAIYLEYAQGFPMSEVGWGAADAGKIAAMMPVREHGLEILRRTPLLAARRGAVMARTVLALLAGGPLPAEAPKIASDVKLAMLAGHDSNLLYLAGLMGLDWTLPDQPSAVAPDTTLAFEVWRAPPDGPRTIRVKVYGQTLDQLRHAVPLDAAHPPDVVPVVPEACAKDAQGCALATFADAVERKLASLCRE